MFYVLEFTLWCWAISAFCTDVFVSVQTVIGKKKIEKKKCCANQSPIYHKSGRRCYATGIYYFTVLSWALTNIIRLSSCTAP